MRPMRAASVCLAAAVAAAPCTGLAQASTPSPGSTAPPAVSDETSLFRAIRAAEMAGDADRLSAWTASDQPPRIRARAALALEAVRLRGAARTVADGIAAEREIDALRASLLAKVEPQAPLVARELALESAEDLLLRLHAFALGDAIMSIGLPSAADIAAARANLAAVDSRLSSAAVAPALAPNAEIATDPAVFRAHALDGLARVLAADLAQCDADGLGAGDSDAATRAAARARATAARAEAQRLLARAGLCELPVPEALGDILALARARVEGDAAMRERMLARAVDSKDPATALIARVVRWRDAGGRGGFPMVGVESAPLEPLARLAYGAELRARLALGSGADALAAPIVRSLQRAGAESREPSASMKRRRATADWFAERLPPEVRAIAEKGDPPLALVAVAALAPDGMRVLDAVPDAAARAARDPLVGPLVALRVAEWRAARSDAEGATDAILAAVRDFDGLPAARDAIAIALELRRLRRGAPSGGAARLDEALALAIERFGSDPAAFGWRCERIDLALFGPGEVADLERASQFLRAIPKPGLDEVSRNSVFLRQIELEYLRLANGAAWSEVAARDDLVPQFVELGKTAMVFDVQALPAIDPQASPFHVRTLPARMSAIRAEIALVTGDAIRARILAERACMDGFVDDETALRAARTWIEASLASGDPLRTPPALREFAARSPALREWVAGPLARLVGDAESALADGVPPKDPPGAIEALAALLSADRAQPSAASLRAAALARLAALDRGQAGRLARQALEADADDRLSRWILAESLRDEPLAASRTEAFDLYRSLAPMSAAERDRFWWRAQLAQLEMVTAGGGREAAPADIVGRVNRLAVLDPALGGPALAKRFEAIRAKALARAGDGKGNGSTP